MRLRVVFLCGLMLLVPGTAKRAQLPESKEDRFSIIQRHVAQAELALRNDEPAVAEAEYVAAIALTLTALGILDLGERNFTSAAQLFAEATSTGGSDKAWVLLGIAELFGGRPEEALEAATKAILRDPTNLSAKRVAAQARILMGNCREALRGLEELHAREPRDMEVVYSIATCYLRLRDLNTANGYFATMRKVRPQAVTHVLIGQTFRDFGYPERAEAELRHALAADNNIPHAHYHLARTYLSRHDPKLLREAADEFRRELQIRPGDFLSNLYLGMVLTKLREYQAAIGPLQHASRLEAKDPNSRHYLGEAYFQTGRYGEAVKALESAIALTEDAAQNDFQVANSHALLGRTLRALGKAQEANGEFEKAKRLKVTAARGRESEMQRDVQDAPAENAFTAGLLAGVGSPTQLSAAAKLRAVLNETLAQAYFNLGVMCLKREEFQQAAEHFGRANRWSPHFPELQLYLGLAKYKAGQFCEAASPLELATQRSGGSQDAKRLLGLAYFRCENYSRAVPILSALLPAPNDIEVQHALGLSLVRSGRAEEGSLIFADLLRHNSDNPGLQIILAQAYAQQKQANEALAALRRALQLDPLIPGVHTFIGKILLKTGSLSDAEKAFRDELALHSSDLEAHYLLAFTLDLKGKFDEAEKLLNQILQMQPNHANARYTLGKILLKKNDFVGALQHLEIAVKVEPNDSSKHFQLGEVYRKLGRREDAQRQYGISQELKKRTSKGP